MVNKNYCLVILVVVLGPISVSAQERRLSERVAETAMNSLWHDTAKNHSSAPVKWTYEYGAVLEGLEGVWLNTGEGRYFQFIQKGIDNFVDADGNIRTYNSADYNLDNVLSGRSLLLLYKVTGQDKYRKAAAFPSVE